MVLKARVVSRAPAWLWAHSPATIPIPGFRTVAQVEQNAGAFAFGPLTADQMHQIDVIFRHSVMT